MTLDGTWGSKDLKALGHTVTRIRVVGQVMHKKRKHRYIWPDGTGCPGIINAKDGEDIPLVVSEGHREDCSFTRSFSEPRDLDRIIKFVKTDECLRELSMHVKELCTVAKNGKHCFWERCQAGDGTKRMVLELKQVDGEFFANIPRATLFDAAGDMFDAVCMRIKMVKKNQFQRNICNLANEDGKLDVRGYEVAK